MTSSVSRFRRCRQETFSLLRLGLPIWGAQLAQSGMSAADVIMSGRSGATDLAAVSVGASLWVPLMLLMTGTLMGLTPIVAYQVGAQALDRVKAKVHQTLWVALALGFISMLALLAGAPAVFRLMEIPTDVAGPASRYLSAVACGIPAVAIYQALRAFSDGMRLTRPTLWISLLGLAVNIPSNFVLIYGGPGLETLLGSALPAPLRQLPAMGATGCGVATAISMWVMCLGMMFYTWRSRRYAGIALWTRPDLPRWREVGELLYLGLPIGLAIFFEVTLFTVVTLLVAYLGEVTVAAHQIALNVTSILFMLPLSLSMALTVRVGNRLGAEDPRGAAFVAWNGVFVGLLLALLNSLLIWLLAAPVVSFYTDDTTVSSLAMSLILLAMLFQISDSLQVNLAGALRGYKDTRMVMGITLVAYWIIGLGSGHLLGRGMDGLLAPLGVHGYWIGLNAGLTSAALLLGWRLWHCSRTRARNLGRSGRIAAATQEGA
ncbi:MATE family efflux transporter [Salinicola avicenniae]|uniref:MATE family efflux transporter n=1 Tax=Salinicola avicenniae TaxID=2916836 RepID=UPI0020740741|nr:MULTISPECIES: MATE family efflux transporter [unclassified Salinicola]